MSRLDFAPKLDDIKITDIKRGLGVFTPKPDKAASFAALKATLKKAGYTLDSAEITVLGTLSRDNSGWWIEADISKQRFVLEGSDVEKLLKDTPAGTRIEVTGDWQTVSKDAAAREVIRPKSVTKIAAVTPGKSISGSEGGEDLSGIQISLDRLNGCSTMFLAPIRTTSLTRIGICNTLARLLSGIQITDWLISPGLLLCSTNRLTWPRQCWG